MDMKENSVSEDDSVREYIRVTPSTESFSREEASSQLSDLHSLEKKLDTAENGVLGSLVPSNLKKKPIEFEFLILSEGKDEPVQMYYSADGRLRTLENHLLEIYPETFTIERVELSLSKKMIEPVKFSRHEFLDRFESGDLLVDSTDLVKDDQIPSSEDRERGVSVESSELNQPAEKSNTLSGGGRTGDIKQVDFSSSSELPEESIDNPENLPVVLETEVPDTASKNLPVRAPESHPEPARKIRVDEGVIVLDPPSEIPNEGPLTQLDRPTLAEDGMIYARPTVEKTYPEAIQWQGKGKRKKDWMTTLRTAGLTDKEAMRNKISEEDETSVLSAVISHLTRAESPLAFQVLFQPKEDWSVEASKRKEDLRQQRDTLLESFLTSILPSGEGAEEMEEVDLEESSRSKHQSGQRRRQDDVGQRIAQISNKVPRRTFEVNIRAVSAIPPSNAGETGDSKREPMREKRDSVDRVLKDLMPVLDKFDGNFYEIEGRRAGQETSLISSVPTSYQVLEQVLEREMDTQTDASIGKRVLSSTRERPEIVMNSSELSALIISPGGEEMSIDAFRDAHGSQKSDTPLTLPKPDLLEKFDEGMKIGYPIDKQMEPSSDPIALPERLLPLHYARFASTGSGKSIAVIQDILSINDEVSGPVILVDPKGDGMCEDYLQTHYAQYGSLDDVLYLEIPDIVPRVSFFDIRPSLEAGRNRESAIQDKISHFHELMEVVMGKEEYRAAYVATDILSFLIESLFDGQHGGDAFTLDELYEAAREMQQEQRVPRSSNSARDIETVLSRHFEKPEKDFQQSMSAVLSRLEKLKQNPHVYRMLNSVAEWDEEAGDYTEESSILSFKDYLDEDIVFLLDIGDLREESKHAVTLILLSQLWDSVQERKRDRGTDYENIVNLIIEEAAPVASSELVYNQLLPQARSFGLSMGLVMQYPSQVREKNERAYGEILNDVHTKLVGPIEFEPDLGEILEFEDMTAQEMQNKITSLPRGEWIASLPSPVFGDRSPVPFSLKSMPIPAGHPESSYKLEDAEEIRFEQAELVRCKERTERHFGIEASSADGLLSEPEERTIGTSGETGRSTSTEESSEEKKSISTSLEADSSTGGVNVLESIDEASFSEATDESRNRNSQGSGTGNLGGQSGDQQVLDVGLGKPDDIPASTLSEKGLSREDVEFLQTVVDAMNNQLSGYDLTESMNSFKNEYDDIHIEELIDLDFLEKHRVARRVYFTVLPDGREFIDCPLAVGDGQGDLGEHTPHKVGVELLCKYFDIEGYGARTQKYHQENDDTVFDAASWDDQGEIQAVGEVETSSNNPESVIRDYEKLVDSGASDVIWVFDNHKTAAEVIEILVEEDFMEADLPSTAKRSSTAIKNYIADQDFEGMTEAWTISQIDNKVK